MRDLVIIGAGPAGLAAAIYGKRAGLDTVVIDESGVGGGQIVSTYEVDNYPGLPLISGFDLGEKFKDHALNNGAEFVTEEVVGIEKCGDTFVIKTDSSDIEAKTVIVATGAKPKKLSVLGEEELFGMGVSYCATCDGAFFKNKTVAVVGGGDVALEDALFLARGCEKVYIVVRRNEFRGAKVLADKVIATSNIEVIYNSNVVEIVGEDQVEKIKIKSSIDSSIKELEISGIFIAVGMNPVSDFLINTVELTDQGYVKANEDCVTSLPGLFVAGDLRSKRLRQVITAAADGANAVTSVSEYLNSMV